MGETAETVSRIAVVIVSVFIAYLLKHFRVVDATATGTAVSKIILHLTLPATTFKVVAGIRNFSVEYLYMTAACLAYTLFIMVPYTVVLCKYYAKDIRTAALFTGALQGFGIGQFAYPIVLVLWGEEALSYVVFFDLANAFPAFIFSYGFQIYAKSKDLHREEDSLSSLSSSGGNNLDQHLLPVTTTRRTQPKNMAVAIALRLIFFPPLWAFALGIICCANQVALPSYITEQLAVFGNANAFLVFLLLGFYLDFGEGDSQGNLQNVQNTPDSSGTKAGISLPKLFLLVVLPRVIFGTLAGYTCYSFLKEPLGGRIATLLLVCFLLPCPPAAIAYAVEFFPDNAPLAGKIVNGSALLSFVAIILCYVFADAS